MRYYWTDERYRINLRKRVTHVVKMVDGSRDHGYCSFTTRVSGKFLNQILLEVLMNCTNHFYLSSSLTASCFERFMICQVCQLYFSGLVCSVLSLDECRIKMNYGRFCVCFRYLEKVILIFYPVVVDQVCCVNNCNQK